MFFNVSLGCFLRKNGRTIARGSVLLFCFIILVGCQKDTLHEGVEIIYHGFQDIDIRSRGPSFPIYIISRHCGYDVDNPSVVNNGHVIISVTDKEVTMIGWDTEDLREGGMVQIDSSKLEGFSVQHGKRWWLKIAEQDRRFSIQNY